MPLRPRTAYTLLTALLILCALAAALFLRHKSPPETARLLPEADAIVFANLAPVRLATHFDRNPISPNSFADFIHQTGILPERDLDAVAIALHRMPDPRGPNGPVGFSEVFAGHFDSPRLATYLAAHSPAPETYAGHLIYSLPSEGRTVRVTLLAYDLVAASNMPTPEQIHSMLDRHRTAANPFAGSSLLNTLYPEVPTFSQAWAVGAIGLLASTNNRISLLGLELPLPADTPFIASLRFTTALNLRIDQLTATPEDAARSARQLSSLLTLARTLHPSPILNSITIEPHPDRATLTATLPVDTLQQLAP